jgi:hypothetical protein
VVITCSRSLLVPFDDDDLERLMLGRSPRFQALLDRSRKSIKEGKAYPRRRSGRPFAVLFAVPEHSTVYCPDHRHLRALMSRTATLPRGAA